MAATFVNSTSVQCVSPSSLRAGLQCTRVAISVDGKTYVTSTSVKVRATAARRILSVAPSSAFAGASVTVAAAFDGNGTFYDETAYCRFGAAAVEAHVLDDTPRAGVACLLLRARALHGRGLRRHRRRRSRGDSRTRER